MSRASKPDPTGGRKPDTQIATIERNDREQFRVQVRSAKSGPARSIDVRLFILDRNGVMTATHKGLSIRPTLVRPIIEALQRAEREAVSEGILPMDEL